MIKSACLLLLVVLARQSGHCLSVVNGVVQRTAFWKPVLYLSYIHSFDEIFKSAGALLKDSAQIDADGNFIFLLPNTSPGIYRIQIQPVAPTSENEIYLGTPYENYIHLYVYGTKDTITIKANGAHLNRSYRISGNPECILFQQIRDLRLPFFEALQSCWANQALPPTTVFTDYASSQTNILQPLKSAVQYVHGALYTFIDSTTNPAAGLLAVAYYKLSLNAESHDKVLGDLSEKWFQMDSSNTLIRDFTKNIRDQNSHLSLGSLVPDIVLANARGENIYLSEVSAKLILVSFWTIDCQNCRFLNTTLISPLLRKYQDQGLQVFSVALYMDKESWHNALERDHLDGIQVADFNKTSASALASTFKIQKTPALFLIDSAGYLIARDPDPRQLEGFIRSYLESN